MKAAHLLAPGNMITVDVPEISAGENEVAIRVAYCGVCGTDMHLWHGKMAERLSLPQAIGHEMSGTIEQVGIKVTGLSVGDRVTVRPLAYSTPVGDWTEDAAHIRPGSKFLGIDTPGAMQARWVVPAETVHRLPQNLPLDIGALVEPLSVACHDVHLAGLRAGETAVVIGGGTIGILIALVAQLKGARVVVFEVNKTRLAALRALGLEAFDPSETDASNVVMEMTQQRGADVVFEVSGSQPGIGLTTELARVRGRIVIVGIAPGMVPINMFHIFWKELQILGARVYNAGDFERAIEIASSGQLPLQKLISGKIPIEDAANAFKSIERGDDVIKLLIDCGADR
ncbi:MAG: hypothetical protein ABS76_30695 [Pelagibacterium sp. SCN 64-44]|nr:MAG: hypothetical protein ABS76_30695 [Pelagibacterium sp. SCN 64-44]